MTLSKTAYLITLDEDWGDRRKNRTVAVRYSPEGARTTADYYRKLGRINVRVVLEVTTQTVIEGHPL